MTVPNPSPEAAFQRAAEELWTPVYRFALAITNDLSDADDVAQEAFARLWARRESVDWTEPILGWLLVTARRIAVDRFRQLARALRFGAAAPPAAIDAHTIDRFVDLRAELARLSPTERASILMAAVEGWTAEEIGASLGVSAGAIRAAASRGRVKLAIDRR